MCNKQRIYVEDIVKMSWGDIEHLEKVVQIGKEEKRKGEEIKMKHTVMVINNIFEGENLLIIKSKGSEIIQRYNQRIEKEMVIEYLNKANIDMDDCLFYIVKNDWRGNPSIEKF